MCCSFRMKPRSPRAHAWTSCLLAAASLFVACRSEQKAPAAAASASASSAPTLPPEVDPELLGRLREIASSCSADLALGLVTCPGGENRRLAREFTSEKRARPAAVATLAHTVASTEAPLQTASANLLNHAFRAPWGNDLEPGVVDATAARALLTAALAAPLPIARQAVPGAVHAALLARLDEEVFLLLNGTRETELSALGYRYVMTHGRLRAFPYVQRLAAEANPALALAALEAPRNMFGWSEPEAAAICPWAESLLEEKRSGVEAGAAELLANCSGKHVDLLLKRGERLLEGGKLGHAELGPYRSLCSESARREPNRVSKQQCERSRKLLTNVVASKRLEGPVRGAALQALAYQWPDAQTLRLARSLLGAEEPKLAEQAERAVKRLEKPAP